MEYKDPVQFARMYTSTTRDPSDFQKALESIEVCLQRKELSAAERYIAVHTIIDDFDREWKHPLGGRNGEQ